MFYQRLGENLECTPLEAMKRRNLITSMTAGFVGASMKPSAPAEPGDGTEPFELRYILSSALFGEMPLDAILPEVAKTGSAAIDIWCRKHGNQREQIDSMGHDAARDLFARHGVKVGAFTRYPLGPFGLQAEIPVARAFGAEVIICGSSGARGLRGAEAKSAVKAFLEKMSPHVEAAAEHGIVIAIENHSSQLPYHPDAIRAFAEFNSSKNLGVAFAPHHLHKFVDEIPSLIRDLGSENLPFIYFQEHSDGMHKKMPKEIEMQQLPGFGGGLDYRPLIKALKTIRFRGYAEIFMHPVPRGIPILPTTAEITAAVNKSRRYIEGCLAAA